MLSLAILLCLLCLSLLGSACVLVWSSRQMGSARGSFRWGLLVAFLIWIVEALAVALSGIAAAKSTSPPIGVLLTLFVLGWGGAFVVIWRGFGLGFLRSFAPFGIYIAFAILQIICMVLVVKPYVIEAFVISTHSMSPTLVPGDRFIVNKLLAPRRLGLVAYRTYGPSSEIFCKRLIGLPGERLRFKGGNLYVNDRQVAVPQVLVGHCHAFPPAIDSTNARYQEGQTITLGNDEYFFIGDNADESGDSRLYGPSHRADLVGVADLIYWPIGKLQIVR